ncbi:MAG TPA: HNH endonuclease [Ilumatobacteraceae bacterium]|nr:HNH endonuclease [Ilumatobacteraceae bacterium]
MEIAAVVERVGAIASVRSNSSAGADLIESGLVAVREVQAWCDAQHAGLVRQLEGIDSFPEQRIANASKKSLSQAAKTTERSTTLKQTPKLADALGDGAITADHVDAVTRASKKVDASKRGELIKRADALAAVAKAGTVDEFTRRLDLETKRLQEDDGLDRLARQRRNARARTWVDTDGMWNLTAKFDPVTGIKIAARIDTTVQTLFGEAEPADCPDDPIEKQRYLAAQAVARLLLDEALGNERSNDPAPLVRPKLGRPEYVVVVHADAEDQVGPVGEFSIPVEIPARVLATLAGDADVHAVVVRNGVVLHAPGELNLGRTTRLANRAQRRALRGLYRCCAIPGCTVAYDRCKLHHIIWWRNQGRTDFDNLLPVCSVHHAKIHNDGWVIELGPNRQLTLHLPDGSVHATGPPGRSQRSTAA